MVHIFILKETVLPPDQPNRPKNDVTPKRRRYSKLKKLLLCLASMSICVISLEAALRWGLIPNPQNNRLQLQGKLDNESHRLLILGDSFIFKPGLLGKKLANELASKDVTVLNLATGGSGPFEYRTEMKAAGVDFKPDVVLLAYYAGNDLTDVRNNPLFRSRSGANKATGVAINRNHYFY